MLLSIKNWIKYTRELGFRYTLSWNWKRKCFNRKSALRNRRKYGAGWQANKGRRLNTLIKRDGYQCQWCRTVLTRQQMTIDHIIDLSDGGRNHVENMRIMCLSCNQEKNKLKQERLNYRPFKDLRKLV